MALKLTNKSEKVNYFGIEVDPEVTWSCWEPGNKYTKRLMLKNVKFVTQKLNFSVPAMEVFTTTFPKTITLSAGTSFCLPITFKPHKKDVFEDQICFENNNGEAFIVPVKALLPQFSVVVPEHVSCGIVAAHDESKEEITVENKSELETPFKWSVEEPYAIEPLSGVIQPFCTMNFTISFKPRDVCTYTMNIPFLYGNKFMHQKILTVTSVAKYPNISIMVDDLSLDKILNEDSQIVVDFGVGSVGKCYEKLLKIQNASQVNASVEIFRCDKSNPYDWVFSCPLDFSPVPSGTCLNVMLQYKPKLTLSNYVENFIIRVSNKCGTYKLKCVARSDGPQVVISHSSINFFQLNPKESATQPIVITNTNPYSEISFQFVLDSNASVFKVDKCVGSIKPLDHIQVIVTFSPQNPIQYYRRITCLVPDQDPIFIDLLGTCHNMLCRPHILLLKHVNVFKNRQLEGLSFFPPETLSNYFGRKLIDFDIDGNLKILQTENFPATCEAIVQLSKWKEYFFSNNETDVVFNTPYIGQDVHSLYFNGMEYIEKPNIQNKLFSGALDHSDLGSVNTCTKTFSLKNNTNGSVIMYWTEMSAEYSVFTISPSTTEISAGETIVFNVTFFPNGSNRIFGTEMEGYAFFKSQRQFELVDERFLSPSFCVLLRCSGHTFTGVNEPFQPKFKFDRDQVIFPSVNTEETAFQSLSLINLGNEPLLFHCKDLQKPFSIKPDIGHVLPGSKQILTIRCEPSTINQFLGSMEIQLNNRKDFIQNIPLLGSADNATVVLDNHSEMFFPPTNIGNTTAQRFAIKNTSRITLQFSWKLKPEDAFTTRMYPNHGTLIPNEIQTQQWFFSPRSKGRIVIKALLMVQGISPFGTLTKPKYFPLRIIGQGEIAELDVVGPKVLKFKPLVVGSSAYQTFDLINTSNASVNYLLHFTKDKSFEETQLRTSSVENYDISDCLTIKDMQGFLPGRCKKTIYVSVRPHARLSYKFNIGYSLIDNDHMELAIMNEKNSLFDFKTLKPKITATKENLVSVDMTGVFPTLQVTDIQGSGSSKWISKVNLWNNLSLDNFNVCLDSDPTTSELIFTMATRASFYRNVPVTTRALIDMNLGAAPQNSEKTEIRILFENCGSTDTKLAFLFPADLEIELEYWAETGKYTEEELHQMKVQDNQLFDIQPRRANISPGESISVCIIYNHLVIGTDRLPVLMKLDKGREILLNLTGVTLHLDRCYIHFPSNKHVFYPTPIGLSKAPIQYYEMHNTGAVPVHFELDISPLTQLTEENYNIPILQCLNPVGDILAGQTLRLEWIFTPVESKTYSVDIPFHMNNGDCPTIQFTAIGYDHRFLGNAINPYNKSPGECGVPSVQSIMLPNQSARLSVERISMGTTPTFAIIRRVVFLNNITTDQNVTFSWNVTDSDDADYVYIYPQQGVLLSGESITCHVIIQSGSIPRFYDINLICEVYDENELIKYDDELEKWQQEEARRKIEFTIVESNVKVPINGKYSLYDKQNQSRKSSMESNLPPVIRSPIKSRILSLDTTPSSKPTPSLSNKDIWFKPEKPKPFFLNLGISGRSCPIDQFKKDSQSQLERFALNKLSMLENLTPQNILGIEPSESLFPIDLHQKEKYIIESVLAEIIGDITEDIDFQDSIKIIKDEAIPFYTQLPNVRTNTCKENNGECYIYGVTMNGAINSQVEEQRILAEEVQDNLDLRSDFKDDEIIVADSLSILQSPAFGALVEGILENMIFNVMSEANCREVDLTSRPRLIALPPRSGQKKMID